MKVLIHCDQTNTKNILTLIEEQGYTIPCNCNGNHRCNGKVYSFDCSMVPKNSMTVEIPEYSEKISSISFSAKDRTPGPADTLLIDLGTTTVALALIDSKTKHLRNTHTFVNPQKKYGSDVISRIQASLDGMKSQLTQVITEALKVESENICKKNGQTVSDICQCYIGGNTTMIHLLLGYDLRSLSASPFEIKATMPVPFMYNNCNVTILPWQSAFVGGDLTAGFYSCRLDLSAGNSLLVDLGTNGEMILSCDHHYYSTSTAAGPAFEGNGLSYGCPGIPGAISHVTLRGLMPRLTTIDDKLPIGICGSGAISVAAELLRKNYVDADGILTEKFPSNGVLLARKQDGTSITFSANDFRTIQLAVAAIAAGIDTLCHTAGITSNEIQHLYVGGGLGFFIDLEDCITLNLFPSVPKESIHVMGNTCLQGLFRYATEDHLLVDSSQIALKNINLANSDYFQKKYITHLTY